MSEEKSMRLGTWPVVTTCAVLTTCLVAYSNRSISGFTFLASFLVWGWKCVGLPGHQLAGNARTQRHRHCAGLWTFVSSASAMLFAAQIFLQLLYTTQLVQPPSQLPPFTPDGNIWQWCFSWCVLVLGLGSSGVPEDPAGGLPQMLQLLCPPLLCLLAAVSESQRCRYEEEEASEPAQEAAASAAAAEDGEQGSQENGAAGSRGSASVDGILDRRGLGDGRGHGELGSGSGANTLPQQPGTTTAGPGAERPAARAASTPPHGRNPRNSPVSAAAASTWPLLLPLSTHADNAAQQPPETGFESQPDQQYDLLSKQGAEHPGAEQHLPDRLPPSFTSTAAVLVSAAALLWPSVASMAYMGPLAWGVHAWSRAGGNITKWFGSAGGRILQAYVALHVLLLYAVQAPLLQATIPATLRALRDAAGLYGFPDGSSDSSSGDEGSGSGLEPADFWSQVAHQAVLHALYAVLGLSCWDPWRQPGTQGSEISLLPRTLSRLPNALPYLANLVSGPIPVAVSLCCISMVEVSVVGACLLALGLWTLLGPKKWGKDALARASPGLTSLLLLWLLAIYAATSLQHYYGIIPPVLQSIGLFAFQSPPPKFLALTGQLITVLFAARLSRNTTRGRQQHSSATLVACTWYAGFWAAPASWLAVAVSRLDLLHAVYLGAIALHCFRACVCPTPKIPSSNTIKPRHRLIRLFSSFHLSALYLAMCGQLPGLELLQRPELEALLKLIGIWHPTIIRDCLPVLISLLICTVHSVAGQWLARAGHVPLGAAAASGCMPGQNPSALASPAIEQQQLQQHQQQQQHQQEQHQWHQQQHQQGQHQRHQQQHQQHQQLVSPQLWHTGSALAAFSSAFGGLTVAAVVACSMLWASPPGILGVVSLILGMALLMRPPRSYELQQRLVLTHSGSSRGGEERPGGTLKVRSSWWRAWVQGWGTVACLAWLCLGTMALLYSAAMVAATSPHSLPANTEQLLEDVVGISMDQLAGSAFVAAIARPVALLLLLQTFRWCLMLDALASWWRGHLLQQPQQQQQELASGTGSPRMPQHDAQQPQQQPRERTPALACDMQQQLLTHTPGVACGRGLLGLVQRAVVLHVDKVQAVLVLAVALQEPGSLGLFVTACLAAAMPLLRGSQLAMSKQHGTGRGAAAAVSRDAPARRWYAAKVVVASLQLTLGFWMLVEYLVQAPTDARAAAQPVACPGLKITVDLQCQEAGTPPKSPLL
ncbi:hypothetical protein DUNSADRAFT_16895 [Dunaliella salina]|uniref:Uncharacterized protein n=1 Tax=Dunaliella salina TaxID=3046 RepID=A0ABQ7H972_DUNSA|nr:hypothetical protein DUNSADRAFT_16895 [Dunaliella salina]|eukprot:KAF5843396.1 hypothetical protein DUNSADRAFT_16895 [Dunaliella salina]